MGRANVQNQLETGIYDFQEDDKARVNEASAWILV